MRDFPTYSLVLVTGKHLIARCWFPCLPVRWAGNPTWVDWSQSGVRSHQWPNWLSEGSSCRQRATTQKVRMVSPLQVKASHPWCYCPLTHAHLHTDTRRCAHSDGPCYFPWLNCMAGSFLTENRTVCLRKVQLPQLRRSGTLPPFTSLPAAPSFPFSLSYSLWISLVLFLQCLTHNTTCESRWTRDKKCI